MPEPSPVRAAGVVVFRPGKRVLLVHRPKYDDWSFPKGKLDRGEHPTAAAVREVAEETGLHVRLGVPLRDQHYPVGGRDKQVSYWVGRVVGDPDVSGYRPNDEIDEVAWLPHDVAAERLSYPYDRDTLAEALRVRHKTVAVVVLRHAEARSRRAWRRDDRERPLLSHGHLRAQHLVALLAAYDVRHVLTSSSVRCEQTVAPYAGAAGIEPDSTRGLSQEDATTDRVHALVGEAVAQAAQDGRGLVICSHRPVLGDVVGALGLTDPGLDPGEMLVVHLRKGRVLSVERHRTH